MQIVWYATHILLVIAGIVLLGYVLTDAFQTIVLPRSANSSLRITGFFYRWIWRTWRQTAPHVEAGNKREWFLWIFGPLSLIMLLAVWAILLMISFALIQFGGHCAIHAPETQPGFGSYLYLSGVTFLTLGYGDISPTSSVSRIISVLEAGLGFGFLALVIGYLPVIYQAFSRREVVISMLDARAGSPPSAYELMRRHARESGTCSLAELFAEWERWAADMLESHLSYPVLMFYRSQHDRQSWLASLTAILDTCALVMACTEGFSDRQARLTFAMGRHALIDLTLILNVPPVKPDPDRLPRAAFDRLTTALESVEQPYQICDDYEELARLRSMYEPYAQALSQFLLVDMPPWHVTGQILDNWEASAWEKHDSAAGNWVLHPSVDTSREG